MRIAIYFALFVAVAGAIKWAYDASWQAGYDARGVAQTEVIRKAERKAVETALSEWENTITIAEREMDTESRIRETVRIIEKNIPVVVEKIVTVYPECNDLGDDFAKLLNNQVRGSTAPGSDIVDVTAEPDPPL